MKIELDTVLGLVHFEDGTTWKINVYDYEKIISRLLNKSQYLRNFDSDFRGKVSKKRYLLAKKEYELLKL